MKDLFLIIGFEYLLNIHDTFYEPMLFHNLFKEIFMFL